MSLFKTIAKMSPLIVVLTLIFVSTPYASAAPSCPPAFYYGNWDADATYSNPNGPPIIPTITLPCSMRVTDIVDYHFNYGQGRDPVPIHGWIGLEPLGTNNIVLKAYASTFIDYFGVKSFWVTKPDQWLPAGTYQVVDSDPATWSYTLTSYFCCSEQYWEPYQGFTRLSATTTPEPGSLLMLGTGALGLAALFRRKLNL